MEAYSSDKSMRKDSQEKLLKFGEWDNRNRQTPKKMPTVNVSNNSANLEYKYKDASPNSRKHTVSNKAAPMNVSREDTYPK